RGKKGNAAYGLFTKPSTLSRNLLHAEGGQAKQFLSISIMRKRIPEPEEEIRLREILEDPTRLR
ncbi:MAG TPA: hypothetical protein PLP45_13620, partial [Syntrophales bacterium]|nr:hypothetical protein [Syntrophales bacterium]